MNSHPLHPPGPGTRGALVLGVLFVLGLALAPAGSAATGDAGSTSRQKESTMTRHATGPFDVKINPLPLGGPGEEPTLGRMSIEKHFHGDLEATSNGQMLTVATDVQGSGVYVAVERVNGTLQGKTGTFALHHRGVMTRGEPHLEVTVVPDSGTGALAGLAGTLKIIIAEGGKHSYDFEYTLPEAK
jgi:hypothetical protein